MTKSLSLLLALLTALPANAAPLAKEANACAPRIEMTLPESEAFLLFNAKLSHLLYHYGKPTFPFAINEIVSKQWPKVKMIQVSPVFYEKSQNLVDQAYLKDAVARTIGLEHPDWVKFEKQMRTLTLFTSTGDDLLNPLDKAGLNLLKAISEAPNKSRSGDAEWNALKAEAIARSTVMYMFMLRWKALNGEIIEEVAQAHGKVLAVAAIGLVGAPAAQTLQDSYI